MVNFNLISLLSLPFALTSAFAPNPTQTRTLVGHTPSFAFDGKAPNKETALFAQLDLTDDQLKFVVADTLSANDVTDTTADEVVKIIKEPLRQYEAPVSSVSAPRVAASRMSIATVGPCEWACFDFAVEAVSLGLQAAGLPGGSGKRIAKALVKRAEKKLKKEMKKIVKENFGSPNPVNIAQGLIKIFGIIIGDVGVGDFISMVTSSLSWWDSIQVAALLTAYFVSGGGGLAVKLALLTPQILDVVEAGIEVGNECS
jgi:hypothetical protein